MSDAIRAGRRFRLTDRPSCFHLEVNMPLPEEPRPRRPYDELLAELEGLKDALTQAIASLGTHASTAGYWRGRAEGLQLLLDLERKKK